MWKKWPMEWNISWAPGGDGGGLAEEGLGLAGTTAGVDTAVESGWLVP